MRKKSILKKTKKKHFYRITQKYKTKLEVNTTIDISPQKIAKFREKKQFALHDAAKKKN